MQEYQLTKSMILEMVKTPTGFAIEDIEKDDIKPVLLLCADVFKHVMPPAATVQYLMADTDWTISKKAVYNGKIVGCYLLNKTQIYNAINIYDVDHMLENLTEYKNKKGVQGVALAVSKEYRDMSFGRQLREIPFNMDADYIWGEHLHGLKNRDNWVNFGRRVVAEYPGLFITLMDLR